jgi:hypothetical protein
LWLDAAMISPIVQSLSLVGIGSADRPIDDNFVAGSSAASVIFGMRHQSGEPCPEFRRA